MRRGVTLIELLIAMTILAVVASVVAATMLGQQRLFQQTYEMVGVRRELRTAMSLVPIDVRGLSSIGGDISAFTETSLTFRSTIGASIVCEKEGTNTLYLPPEHLTHNTLTSFVTRPEPGDTLYTFDEGPLRGAEDDAWLALTITSVTPVLTHCMGEPFTDPLADAAEVRYRVEVEETVPETVLLGAGVRFTRHVEYALQESPATKRWYLTQQFLRSAGWDAPVVVSGPYDVPERGGMKLVYFDSTGVEVAPGGASTSLARVDLTMQAAGLSGSALGSARGSSAGSTAPRDSIALRIAIRNRQ